MNAAQAISAPEHLSADHNVADFDSGEPSLDDWLRRRALANEGAGASRTYVVSTEDRRVVGYYSLATGAILRAQATSGIARNMPEPIPVMLLGRLAVDQAFQGSGIGGGLLKSAVQRTLAAADIAGIRAMLLHALSEKAKAFYAHYGFVESPTDPMTMMATLVQLEKSFRDITS